MQVLAAKRAMATVQGDPNFHSKATIQDDVLDYLQHNASRLQVLEAVIVPSATFHPTGTLNPYAPVFFPGDVAVTEWVLREPVLTQKVHSKETAATITIQSRWRGWRARKSLQCKVCENRPGRCICEDSLCLQCFRSADVCVCSSPAVKLKRCARCGWSGLGQSLHDREFLSPPSCSFKCNECGGSDAMLGEYMWLTPSEPQCDTCLRRDRQWRIQSCDGRECGTLHHSSCMTSVSPGNVVKLLHVSRHSSRGR